MPENDEDWKPVTGEELDEIFGKPEVTDITARLPRDEIPVDLKSAVELVVKTLPPDNKEYFRWYPEDPYNLKGEFARWIREAWGLFEDSPLKHWFRDNLGISHPDDISRLILECAIEQIRFKPWLLQARVDELKNNWTELGIDPAGF